MGNGTKVVDGNEKVPGWGKHSRRADWRVEAQAGLMSTRLPCHFMDWLNVPSRVHAYLSVILFIWFCLCLSFCFIDVHQVKQQISIVNRDPSHSSHHSR